MTTLNEMMGHLPADRRKRVEVLAVELIAEEMTLPDLRKAREMTQARMAELLGVGQDSISRLEKRSDLLLSTLRDYLAAMGGNLRPMVEFPDRPPVSLSAWFEAKRKTRRRTGGASSPP
jgi:DNA-binding XRE family transcriptional regulator